MINVKEHGVKGDGVTDDTDSLRAILGNKSTEYRAIYMPAGTYLIRSTLTWGSKKRVLFGEKRAKTIIKLMDNSPGYDHPGRPKYVVDTKGQQFGGQNFFNYIRHLTVLVGNNNPGAIGISFQTNNSGAIFDVDVISTDGAGTVGIDLTQEWPGPGYIKNVTIDGFNYGVKAGCDQYSMTLENVTIRNCKVVGLENDNNTLSTSNLLIQNCPVGIRNQSVEAMLTLINTTIQGTGMNAIENLSNGGLLVRNLVTKGYGKAIRSEGGTDVTGPMVSEWLSHPALRVFDSPEHTLNLPIESAPEVQYANLTAGSYALLSANGDITAALQNAIDRGVKTIYITSGAGKTISASVQVRNQCQHIMGLGNAYIKYATNGAPVFIIRDGTSPTVTFEHLYSDAGSNENIQFEQATRRTLVVRAGSASFRNVVDGGKVFMEDVVGQPFNFKNMKAWIRDINTETYDFTHIVNDGAELWILGHKTEKDQTIIDTKNGGKTELLGGLIYKNRQREIHPAFVINQASVSLSYRTKGIDYPVHVVETRSNETRDLPVSATYAGRSILFAGYSDKTSRGLWVPAKRVVKALTLTSMCSTNPSSQRRWRIRNPNDFLSVEVKWKVRGTSQANTLLVPPGEAYFMTNTVPGNNATLIEWLNENGVKKQISKASSGAQCSLSGSTID